ncbi:TPA: hypothetical protein DCQ85_02825 [Candidatus Magasanikbacteria bacterium]|nr:hypothetical protein [Candidatus Magasanikbacteria bacterium]
MVAVAGTVGLNTIGGVQSVVDDDMDTYMDQARADAVAKAKLKAVQLANTLGVMLDGVISYSEYSSDSYPMYAKSMDSSVGMGGGSPVIEPGTNEVSINVNVTYKIK